MQPSAPSGRAYPELGQPQQAIPHLKAALPIDDDGNLHCLLARAYQTSGQADLRKGDVEGLPGDREVGGGRGTKLRSVKCRLRHFKGLAGVLYQLS